VPLVLLNKPYRVLSQFRDADGRPTLSRFISDRRVYPAGRLDFESEGLLLLTDDGGLQASISQPGARTLKVYWAQVEGTPSHKQLDALGKGVQLADGPAAATFARAIDEPPGLWARDPPIRHRVNVPDHWLEIGLLEGRNRQVRRMTAAVGLPTLRLVRNRVGPWALDGLRPGESRSLSSAMAWRELREYRARDR
jgi:23S rRNA pseudouridine2457 synthase